MKPWAAGDQARLAGTLERSSAERDPVRRLALLVREGLDAIPQPGAGQTLARWQALASVARSDLSLAKIYEGHTDALAILSELGETERTGGALWAVWASEAPQARVLIERGTDRRVVLRGRKNWCSGARGATHALLTAWHADGRGPVLVQVDLGQAGIAVVSDNWHAVGMAASESLDVLLDDVTGHRVGEPGDYLRRPGFWQGGAGIAACWYGGMLRLAETLRQWLTGSAASHSPFRLSALGQVDMWMANASATLRNAAAWIDEHSASDAQMTALHARLTIDCCARRILDQVGQAMGATPFCRDPAFARTAADLPVFLRQGHAERDFAALGALLIDRGSDWGLG